MFILVVVALLASIIAILLSRTNIEFSGYKPDRHTDLESGASAEGMLDAMNGDVVIVLIGALLIFAYYYVRFSQWADPPRMRLRHKPPRHFTSGSQYVLHASLYAASFVVFYSVLLYVPGLLQQTGSLANADPSGLLNALKSQLHDRRAAVPYAVILVTMIVPTVFARYERAFRRELQTLAYIPAEAQALVRQLVRTPTLFFPHLEYSQEILKQQREAIIREEDLNPEATDAPALHARLQYHLDCLKRLGNWRRFSLMETRYKDDIESIEKEHGAALLELAKVRDLALKQARERLKQGDTSFFNDKAEAQVEADAEVRPAELGDDDLWVLCDLAKLASNDPLLSQRVSELQTRLADLLEQLYETMVALVLALERFPHERGERFAALGLHIESWNPVFISRGDFILLGATAFTCAAVPTLAYLFAEDVSPYVERAFRAGNYVPNSIGDAFSWIVMGMIMHLTAMTVAILTKRWITNKRMSSILRERRPNHREYSDYFDAVALAFSANVFILLLFAQMDTSGRAALSETWYWSFVPAMTAAATVWHLDAFAFNRLVPAKGLFAQGLATAAMALFIAFIDKEYRGAGNEELIVFAAYLAIVTFCIGGGLGYWFPRLYLQQMIYHRQHPERRRNRRVPKELEGTWRTVGKAVPVHTLDISRCGCRVKEDLGSHTGTVGRIAFANKWECTARIARTSDDDTAIEFLPDEAWRWFEHQIYKAA